MTGTADRVSYAMQNRRGGAVKIRRALEHHINTTIRLRREDVDVGLHWAETGRGDCLDCHKVSGRRWVGFWFECMAKIGRPPFSIVQTPPLCAFCTMRRQDVEKANPVWRMRGSRRG